VHEGRFLARLLPLRAAFRCMDDSDEMRSAAAPGQPGRAIAQPFVSWTLRHPLRSAHDRVSRALGGDARTDRSPELYSRSEYHDHGHDTQAGPARGLEKRRFRRINLTRMMELQGAIGLAQLRKMGTVIPAAAKRKQGRIREALSIIDQVTFREILTFGDTATFSLFSSTPEKAKAFNKVMTEAGAGAVYWYENFWHYYDQWSTCWKGKACWRTGYPFKTREGRGEMPAIQGAASQNGRHSIEDPFHSINI